MDSNICVWDRNLKCTIRLKGHTKWITSLAWEPKESSSLLVSGSKDCTARVWNARSGECVSVLSQHTDSITGVKWSTSGMIFTSSRDRTIKVWTSQGNLLKTLSGHAHWINCIALSDDTPTKATSPLRLVSGSEDSTIILWKDIDSNMHSSRLTGHQATISDIRFSPNSLLFASASFDKSIKLWNGQTGQFICSFRGHVGPIYQLSWSSDSQSIASCSKDFTVKVWSIQTKKIANNLVGHSDEVFCVLWTDSFAVSGGKDKSLRM